MTVAGTNSLANAFGAGLLMLALLWFAVGLILFGIPAGWLAGQKGRSELLWIVLGILIGPVAILTIGLAPRHAGGRFIACADCREAIDVDAARCPFCHTAGWKAASRRETPTSGD